MKNTARKYHLAAFLFVLFVVAACAEPSSPSDSSSTAGNVEVKKKPRVVIGIVVDQMKWEYLRRFAPHFSGNGAFKKLMNKGFECANTHYNYVPTVTAAGHASVYTGTTPAMHGIIGNSWYDRKQKKEVYCTHDTVLQQMSPKNLWATTVTDEFRLSTHFKGRVYGIAPKDRSAILPAGHSANAAFWLDTKAGKWTSSSYYSASETEWINSYDAKKEINDYYKKNWTTLYDSAYYGNESTAEDQKYHGSKLDKVGFPYKLDEFVDKDFSKILSTPWGNSLTISFTKRLIEEKNIGIQSNSTDFLAIGFSSTDYVGHAFGPDSKEVEDTYLRLDKELGEFISYLEQKFGQDFLLFLTADHGVSHIPQFLNSKKLPGKDVNVGNWVSALNEFGKNQFNIDGLIEKYTNAQLYLNIDEIAAKKIDKNVVIEQIKEFLINGFGDEIVFVVNNHELAKESIPTHLKEEIINGFSPTRSGDVSIIFRGAYFSQGGKGTSHSSAYKYDTHVPLLFYGKNIVHGKTMRETSITDIAVTVAYLLDISTPNASIGKPILEILQPMQ